MSLLRTHISLSAIAIAAAAFLGVQPTLAQDADTKPMLRLIFAGGPVEAQKAVLASKTDNGKWKRLAGMDLKGTMVSDWLPSLHGELHILLKRDGKPESVCQFIHPAEARRALVILTYDEEAKSYSANVVDPVKENFAAGSTLVVNTSKLTAIVAYGSETPTIEAGRHLVAKPATDEDGGYSVMVYHSSEGADKKLVYDRRAIANPKSRNIFVLIADPSIGLRVVNLSEFGPFE